MRIASRCSYARAAPDAFAILSRYARFYEELERERERERGRGEPGSLRNRGFMGRMEREDESHGGTRAVGQHTALPTLDSVLFTQSRPTGNHYRACVPR